MNTKNNNENLVNNSNQNETDELKQTDMKNTNEEKLKEIYHQINNMKMKKLNEVKSYNDNTEYYMLSYSIHDDKNLLDKFSTQYVKNLF